MKILVVTGTRKAKAKTHLPIIKSEIRRIKPQIVIEGGAEGVDSIARKVCEDLCIPVMTVKADWTAFGKAAGHKRNGRMIMLAALIISDVEGLSFVPDDPSILSKGTRNCIEQMQKAGISVTEKEIKIEEEKEVWVWTQKT